MTAEPLPIVVTGGLLVDPLDRARRALNRA